MTLPIRRLDSNYDMTFGQGLSNFATDDEALKADIVSRLLSIQGEWFLDTSFGVPWLDNDSVSKAVTDMPADLPFVESSIKSMILDTDGVSEITDFSMTFDHNTRSLSISVTVLASSGTTTTTQVTL